MRVSIMTKPTLYSFRRCPYAMRARLALAVSGQVCEVREVKIAAKPAAMLEVSPKGTVPVLVLADGTVIDESLDVMRWALGQNDPENWLARDDGALIAQNDGPFKYHLDRYKYPQRHDSDPLAHRGEGEAILAQWNARLIDKGGQLAGPDRGLADMAIMPFVRQFASVDPDWFAGLAMDGLQTWLSGHMSSDLFQSIMMRLKPWSEGDEIILFDPQHRAE
jgi:glutathione S-transferase